MIVGLLDWSLTRWRSPTVFNLELMKIAYYHKVKERDITKMLFGFDSERFEKVYVYKDYEDFIYPSYIMSDPKTVYGGLATTDGAYHPLPEEIENCPADPSIYNSMFRYYKKTSDAKAIFNRMQKACHMRMSLDGTMINPLWHKQLTNIEGRAKTIIFHDKSLNKIQDVYHLLTELGKKYGVKSIRYGFKFPPMISSPDELLVWGQILKAPDLNNIHLLTLMPDEVLEKISLYKQKITYHITPQYWTEESFIAALPQILLQALFLSKWAIPLLLKVDEGLIGQKEWLTFVDMFNEYSQSCVMYRNKLVFSAYVYCKYCYYSLQEEEKLFFFSFIKDQNPTLFDLLYDTEYVTYDNKKKRFIPHLYSWAEIDAKGGYGGPRALQKRKEENEKKFAQYSYDLVIPEGLYLD